MAQSSQLPHGFWVPVFERPTSTVRGSTTVNPLASEPVFTDLYCTFKSLQRGSRAILRFCGKPKKHSAVCYVRALWQAQCLLVAAPFVCCCADFLLGLVGIFLLLLQITLCGKIGLRLTVRICMRSDGRSGRHAILALILGELP
jgi:hypothetical protein